MKSFLHNTWKHRAHVVMALPAFLILFFIMYVPMAGLVMAFKNFDYTLGIWKSPWNGIDNFKFLLASNLHDNDEKYPVVLHCVYGAGNLPQCSTGNRY